MRRVTVRDDGREIRELIDALVVPARRTILGICGPPGAGKTTLTQAIAAQVPGAVAVPMDGFHLADIELRRTGLLDRKGAPETFDAWGYAALLTRLRSRPSHVVLAPTFDRELEQPTAGALAVPPAAGLIVTEGNYLLVDRPEWQAVRAPLDAVWHVTLDPVLRLARLVARHERFGKSPRQARAWVTRVDEPNAVLVESSATGADVVLDLTAWEGRLGNWAPGDVHQRR